MEKVQMKWLQKMHHIDIKMPFQLLYLLTACEAYSRNI